MLHSRLRGLLVDYGGVLTTSLFASFASFCAQEGIARSRIVELLRTDQRVRAAVIGLELGTLAEAEFEAQLGAALGVRPERLIARLMAGATPDLRMRSAVRAAKARGIRTGLVSNSWGSSRYPRAELGELFHGVVISGEVGVRKPSRVIYELGARAIGVSPERCVFVDDLRVNLSAARALGMTTVHHRETAGTISQLERLLGVGLGGDGPQERSPGVHGAR
jgi:putative hydrolase of the HAD superfamily